MNVRPRRNRSLAVIIGALILIVVCVAFPAIYTVVMVNLLSRDGVYATPQQGVIERANRFYCDVQKVDIEQAGTNSFDGSSPHVWYVMYTIYASHHTPCDPAHPGQPMYHGDYERGGNFYLNTRSGWIFVSEGYFPEIMGYWMKVLGLAGPGDPTHTPRN